MYWGYTQLMKKEDKKTCICSSGYTCSFINSKPLISDRVYSTPQHRQNTINTHIRQHHMSDFLEELLKMAESAVKEELICLDNFNNPKVLPCCHSFCLHCLKGAHERTKNKNGLTCADIRYM